MKREEEDFGNEAFLDVVANMTGVLIILIFVIGSRTKQRQTEIETEVRQTAVAKLDVNPRETVDSVRTDIAALEQKVSSYNFELASRRQERGVILTVLAEAEESWQAKEHELADSQRQAGELAVKRRELLAVVQNLELNDQTLSQAKRELIAVEHLPTPIAQTVFGEEIHFRLSQGRLAVVPLDTLVDAIKRDMQRTMNGAVREGEHDGTVGPIRDFSARYKIATTRGRVNQNGQVTNAVRMEVAGLVIEPERELIGENLSEATRENSQLEYELAGRDPRTTTITVWVYPDSFAEFTQLKSHLYRRGFATAARPLPAGRPITGSPTGSRSTAQ